MSEAAFPTEQRFQAVERHVREMVAAGELPHAQFLASRGDGEAVHSFHCGTAREDGTPLAADAVFRIASMTKAVTAVLALMLVEEGRIALDDPVACYLPELADLAVYAGGELPPFATRPAARQPLIIDLFRHTAGFTYGLQQQSPLDRAYWTAGIFNFKARFTGRDLLATLADLPLVHDPGDAFTYSVATDLLGIIAERVTDRPLSELFRSRIFVPLGMGETGFVVPQERQHRLPDSWFIHPRLGRRLYDPAEGSLWAKARAFESGGGGLASTVVDYLRFCRMLLRGGTLDGGRLLRPDTVAQMTRNHLPGGGSIGALSTGMFAGAAYAQDGQGLGIAVTLAGGTKQPPAGEVHWSGLFGTWFSIIPALDLILIFMTQLIPATDELLAADVHRRLFA